MSEPKTALIGTWESDPEDFSGSREYPRVTLKFGTDGTLLYIAHEGDKDQIMRLTYVIEEDFIITNQESLPHLEKTKYELTCDGELLLALGGEESRYVRAI